MSAREDAFNRLIEEYDAKALSKVVNFAEHRFVSIERDAVTGDTYAKGHKTMRGACGHMARAVQEGDTFLPVGVIDLDQDTAHEVDLFAFVAPKTLEAVAVLMPRDVARDVLVELEAETPGAKLIQQAIDRR